MKIQKPLKSTILLVLILAGANFARGIDKEKLLKFHQLNRDIVLLNLINGLYLTPEQTEILIQKIEAAEQARENFAKELDRRKDQIEDVLKEVREVLLKGQEIPDDLKKRVHRMKDVQHRLKDERSQALIRLENEVKELLTPNQLIVIEEYKPCTIPPSQGKIGQSVETAAEGAARLLARIRRMSQERYELTKEMFVDFHLDRIERHLGFEDAEEREQYRQQALEVFETARSLSDKEFLVQKGELARRFLPEDVKTRKHRKNQLGRVGHFLLDPALIPILKERSE